MSKRKYSSTQEYLRVEAERIMLEKQFKDKVKNKVQPVVGPRVKLMHYIKDLKLNVNEAFKKILTEFPDVSREELITWYREEKEKDEKGGKVFDYSR